jgi:hypothetical protein
VFLDWQGIIPGKSTRQDVIDILGKPDKKGIKRFYDGRFIPYYQYNVEGGVVSNFVQDRIFFRSGGVVDWMQIVVSDRDGTFHGGQEIIGQLGNVLDNISSNDNSVPNSNQWEVIGGIDRIWVWSECGLALIAFDCSPSQEAGKLTCPEREGWWEPSTPIPGITLRHANPSASEGAPVNPNAAILMKFLFPPTNYAGFIENYGYRIPFGIWDEYINQIERTEQ